jgi:glyoxylase-like metal-dependent hydrolase (beta-lactamase superfamily II)
MQVHAQFDPETSSLSYVVWDPETRDAVVVDPVLDYDPAWVRVGTASVERLVAFVRERSLRVHYVLDTHVHADHLSGGVPLREAVGGKLGIGAQIGLVQARVGPLFGWGPEIPVDGRQWDVLARHGEVLSAGSLEVHPIHTPGHTPSCVTYRIGDALFTGDALFMPDFGTGRCDFPGGSSAQLYDSVQALYTLPEATRVFVGHDYQPGGRELRYQTTIGESRRENVQLRADTDRETFATWRRERDATLQPPKLILQALQVNAAGGRLPEPDERGIRSLRLPLGVL